MNGEHLTTAGDVAATGFGQILDTRPKGYWGRVAEHRPDVHPNCYRVVRLYDGRPDFPDLDPSTNEAYEVHGRDDVPLGTLVRLFRANWGPYWTFSYGEGPGEPSSGSGGSGSGSGSGSWQSGSGSGSSGHVPCTECLARLCVTRDPYTGAIIGIYYQTDAGLVPVPDCGSGSGFGSNGSGSGSGSGNGDGSGGSGAGSGGECGECAYMWNGTIWYPIAICTPNCECPPPPTRPGDYVGETVSYQCFPSQ